MEKQLERIKALIEENKLSKSSARKKKKIIFLT